MLLFSIVIPCDLFHIKNVFIIVLIIIIKNGFRTKITAAEFTWFSLANLKKIIVHNTKIITTRVRVNLENNVVNSQKAELGYP